MTEEEKPEAPIRGQVAQVVSDRELILNRGFRDGIRDGMYFKILNPNTREITDPETGEDIGGFNIIKIVVVAIQVGDRITLARTFRRRTVNLGGSPGINIGSMFAAPKYEEQIERLRLDEQAPRTIAPEDSVVDVGDPFEVAEDEEIEDIQTVTVWE